MLYAICYMLYAICYMLYAICYMLYAIFSMLYAICCMLYAIFFILYCICYMLYSICYMLYAICYILYAICYMLNVEVSRQQIGSTLNVRCEVMQVSSRSVGLYNVHSTAPRPRISYVSKQPSFSDDSVRTLFEYCLFCTNIYSFTW